MLNKITLTLFKLDKFIFFSLLIFYCYHWFFTWLASVIGQEVLTMKNSEETKKRLWDASNAITDVYGKAVLTQIKKGEMEEATL